MNEWMNLLAFFVFREFRLSLQTFQRSAILEDCDDDKRGDSFAYRSPREVARLGS